MKNLICVILCVYVFAPSYGQESVEIIKPEVYDSYVMFKKTITRRMDLKEKQNAPFFATGAEISSLLVEAVKEGLLKAYKTDSCINLMTDEEFMELSPTFFTKLYIKEDIIFDRNRSRMYYYIRTVTLATPAIAGYEEDGFRAEKAIASFRYEDLVSLFRGPMADRANWYNQYNQAAHMNYGDAFELRLFSAPIIKISNADNLDIRQQFAEKIAQDPLNAIIIQQQYEMDLMEYESELWEY